MESESPCLRLARTDDIDSMECLMRLAVLELSKGYYNDDQIRAAVECLTQPDPDLIEDETSYVVESEGELAAVGAWSTRKKLHAGAHDQEALTERISAGLDPARIRAFYVHPRFAGKGLGHKVYRACEHAAIEAGFTAFELMATLPGAPFYRKMGFLGDEIVDVMLVNGSLLPCVPMKKQLV